MRAGDTASARELLAEQEEEAAGKVAAGIGGPQAPWALGVLFAIQERTGAAMEHLRSAAERDLIPSTFFFGPPQADPRLASLRDDPRFIGILETIEETKREIRGQIESVADQLRPPLIPDDHPNQ
jgi:hypothetical protein